MTISKRIRIVKIFGASSRSHPAALPAARPRSFRPLHRPRRRCLPPSGSERRHQALDNKPASHAVPFHALTRPIGSPRGGLHRAPDEIVVVIRAAGSGCSASTLTRSSMPANASAAFIVSTPARPIIGRPRWNRTLSTSTRSVRAVAPHQQHRSGLEALFRKIRRRIHNDLPAISVRARDAPHQHHVVPLSVHLDSADSKTPGLSDSRTLAQHASRALRA